MRVAAVTHSGISSGANVAMSDNTAVVAASADGDKGHLAGAVYVFVRSGTTWSQQQKLTGNDTKAGDRFGFFAVAIEGNTIVVGVYKQDCGCTPPQPEDNRGAAYVFTRNGTVWTQQTRISPSGAQGGAPGNLFGTGVAISGDTIIVGSTAADVSVTNAGAAYVYRLDCTPPAGDFVLLTQGGLQVGPQLTVCPGTSVGMGFVDGAAAIGGRFAIVQGRPNGVDLPGAAGVCTTTSRDNAPEVRRPHA